MKKTIENLTKAFIGESQARNRYNFYSKVAKKAGFEQIAEIFLITADNERLHAKRLFEHINELKKKNGEKLDEIVVEAVAPTIFGDKIENLKAAIAGEHYENSEMYPRMEKEALTEGHPEIAKLFKEVGEVEKAHEARYRKLLANVENGEVFKKPEVKRWKCANCGYIHEGTDAPEVCPACSHPQAHFEVFVETY